MSKRTTPNADFYAGNDPRELGAYPLKDVARYLRLPPSTLHAWMAGHRNSGGSFKPIFPTQRTPGLLSFNDLVRAHIIGSLRLHHHVSMQRVRKAIDYLSQEKNLSDPLLNARFLTDGVDIFVEQICEGTVNASQGGQMAIRPILAAYLKRIEYDDRGVAKLYPFIRRRERKPVDTLIVEPRLVVMDPKVAFGRPVLAGTSIRTSVISDRYLAGESMADLAEDYHRTVTEIEEAVRCESSAA